MIIIDNSLCNTDISKRASEQNIHEYLVSLFESGIDIAEIDINTLKYFDEINTSRRFIMRVESLSELLYAQNKEFYYIVLPYDMLNLAKLKLPAEFNKSKYLVEVNGEGSNIDEVLKMCRNAAERNPDGAIRVVKSFDLGTDPETDTDELSDFIDRYYAECTLPLDLCPLNSRLTGLDAAYKAFSKDINMLTLGFSASCFYTPYELFVMYFPESYRIHPQLTLIPYLLVCAARYSFITDEPNKGLDNIVNVLDTCKKPVINVDSVFDRDNFFKRAAGITDDPFEAFSAAQNSLFRDNALDVDFFACKKLAEVLDSSDMILYNRFFNKDDFKN